jgi:hypothetical protein
MANTTFSSDSDSEESDTVIYGDTADFEFQQRNEKILPEIDEINLDA